eukprot:1440607-Pleurochrysis_carterae.AAC.1
MLCFYDLATKYLEVYYLSYATAAEVQNCFKTFLADNHGYLSGRLVTWLTDNGSEFFEKNLEAFIREFLIRHKSTVPYSPQTNLAEQVWSLVLRPCRICLAATNVSEWLRPWAINQIVSIHNALVTRRATAIAHKTPCEMKTGTQLYIDKFRTLFWSATCYLRGKAQELSKLAPRVAEGIHLGIDQRRGGYF